MYKKPEDMWRITLLLLVISIVAVPGKKHGKDNETKEVGKLWDLSTTQSGSGRNGTIYLALRMSGDGVLYKIEAYFLTTDPVYLQIWRPQDGNDKYKLIYQKKVYSNRELVTKTMEMSRQITTTLQCPTVKNRDMIGIYSLDKPTPIPLRLRDKGYKLLKEYSTTISLDTTLTFRETSYSFQFSIKASIVRRSIGGQDFMQCPASLKDGTPVTTSYAYPDFTSDDDTARITQLTTSQYVDTDGMTSVTDIAVTSSQSETETSESNVLPIVLGVVAGVVAVGAILTVVMVIYCKRRSRDDKSKMVDGSLPVISGNDNPADTVQPHTKNPAYGTRGDLSGSYETTVSPRPPPLPPNVYQPIIPPRPGHPAQSNLGLQEPEEQSKKPHAYEEIDTDGPRPRFIDKSSSTPPGENEDSGRVDRPSELYEDFDPEGTPAYLEILPDPLPDQ